MNTHYIPNALMRSRSDSTRHSLGLLSIATTDSIRNALVAMAEEKTDNDQLFITVDGKEVDLTESIDSDALSSMDSLWESEDEHDIDPFPFPVVPLPPPAVVERKSRKRQRPNNDIDLERRVYYTPTDSDVCLGRGGWTNKHPGNCQFREWTKSLKDEYFAIEKKLNRTSVAQRLLDFVHENHGRFLGKDEKGWYKVSDQKAREKCSQVLRDSKITPEDRATKRAKYAKKKKEATKGLLL